jgi:release factor glutamine methyltransferase
VLHALPTTPPEPSQVLELGTGSGAIAISVALSAAPHAVALTAVDLSAGALEVARANAARLGAPVRFLASNWFSNVSGRFSLIASNPPYIADDDAHLTDLQHEPLMALTAESGGLGDIEKLIAQAHKHLLPGGYLLLEHGWQQGQAVRALFEQAGYGQIEQRRDLAGIIRCTGGRWLDN